MDSKQAKSHGTLLPLFSSTGNSGVNQQTQQAFSFCLLNELPKLPWTSVKTKEKTLATVQS